MVLVTDVDGLTWFVSTDPQETRRAPAKGPRLCREFFLSSTSHNFIMTLLSFMRELFPLTHVNQTGHTPRQQTVQGRAHRQGAAGGGRSHAEEEAGEGNGVDDGEEILNIKRVGRE